MSQTEIRRSLGAAKALADKIIKEYIGAYCERCEIAGSVRREKAMVGDIDIVCIPKQPPALFDIVGDGYSWNMLQVQLEHMVMHKKLYRANKGNGTNPTFYIPSLYDKAIEKNFKLEISMTTAEAWPVLFAIKTGCAEFSKRLVTLKNEGGYLPSDCKVEGGWQVWRGDERLQFADEREFIEFCCGRWLEPQEREV